MERKGNILWTPGGFLPPYPQASGPSGPGYLQPVRQLLPVPTGAGQLEVDPIECYASDAHPRPPDRPWVLTNMVSSADGAATSMGTSGGLGSAADKAAFGAIRAVADVILVAAGTVRAERYRAAQTPPHQQQRRRDRGQSVHPRFCVLSAGLDLDPTAGLFNSGDDRPPPLVATTSRAPADRRRQLEAVAEVVAFGQERVELHPLLQHLADVWGAGVVLCEGGPSLIGQLVAEDLIDEFCLTVSPMAVGGPATRIAHASVDQAGRPLHLDRVLEADGLLLLRYHRDRSVG